MNTFQETPGYGISGYFSLEDAAPANAIAKPIRQTQQALRIQVNGGRIQVLSNQASATRIQARFFNAQGRVLQSGAHTLPPGGGFLKIPASARGVLTLEVDGGELGRSIMLLPPTLHKP